MFKKELKFQLKPAKVTYIYINNYIVPLAYLMAKTHGLKDFEKTLEESIKSMEDVDTDKILEQADNYAKKGKAMLPLRPLYLANEVYQ